MIFYNNNDVFLFNGVFCLNYLLNFYSTFNLDTDTAVFKLGPKNSYFGYSVAQHFMKDSPRILVGAPRGESKQPGTHRTGALYSCPVNTISRSSGSSWCNLEQVEYERTEIDKQDRIPEQGVYFNNKTDQFLGSTLSSGGGVNSQVVVCAPNLLFDSYANMDGACYLLDNDLKQSREIRTCRGMPKKGRHNSYGQCQEGFSAVIREDFDLLVTGLPGPKRWVGGVVAQQYINKFGVSRLTLQHDTGLEKVVGSHAYLGYSVGVGSFGFYNESSGGRTKDSRSSNQNFTIVAGSPRYNESGAVFFLPFSKSRTATDFDTLALYNDYFKLTGAETFASTFGYSLAVLDIDRNGYDDLLVGAPHYYEANPSKTTGGAVFVYFATGRNSENNEDVFHKPIVIIGRNSFGTSLTSLGDLNQDGFNDFAIGAPYDTDGGSVHIYLGSPHQDFDPKPSQIIYGRKLSFNPVGANLKTFGWSLSGGVDLDRNGYPDLLVGAFGSDAAVLLRSKPVIIANALILEKSLEPIDKEKPRNCGQNFGSACFVISTKVTVDEDLILGRFICKFEVLIDKLSGALRAHFDDGKNSRNFSCQASKNRPFRRDLSLFIPETNRDWLNPIKMKFSVILDARKPAAPSEGGPLTNLNDFPVLDNKHSVKEFKIEFDNKCGPDRRCVADLKLNCSLPGLSLYADEDKFLKDAGKDGNIDLKYVVHNNGERAYETLLYVIFDENWVERPQIIKGKIKEGNYENGMVEYILGNPLLEQARVEFTLRFSVIKDKSGRKMPKEPIKFSTFVNTTSSDVDLSSNNCTVYVKVVTKTELSLNGYTTPRGKQLLFGGRVVGESAMEYFEDVGPEVQHIYELKNEGPWPVNDISVDVDFPYEINTNSTSFHGKWALYITDEPTITVANPAQTTPVTAKPCELAYKKEIVNPLQLKAEVVLERHRREAGSFEEPSAGGSRVDFLTTTDNGRKLILGRQTRQLRIKPKEVLIHGSRQKQVTIDCNPSPRLRTAKCVLIRCPVKFLAHNGNATVTIISRLWNSTFVEDYRDVQDIDIISRANITVSSDNPIEESDYSNNYAYAVTKANPDAPTITEQAAIPLWIIILAILGGILLLLCITLLLWKGMLSSLLKEHIAKQNARKESLESCKNDALKSANHLTNTVIDTLNSRVSVAYSNQRKLDIEAKKLQANVAALADQTVQWAKLVDNFNHVLKEIGDVETWSKTIEKDMSSINGFLENAYKCQQSSQK